MVIDVPELKSAGTIAALVTRWRRNNAGFANALARGVPPGQAFARLGVQLCLQESYDDAVEVLRAAAELEPDDCPILNNLAVVLERAGRLDEAVAAANASLKIQPQQADVWLHLANMLKTMGDFAAAEPAYETALELKPTWAMAWQMLGLLRQEQRRFREAIDCFLKCANNGHASAAILAILGQLFHQVGEFQKSLHAYGAAVEMQPANAMYCRMQRQLAFLVEAINSPNVEAAIQSYSLKLGPHADEADRDIDRLLKHAFSLLSAFGHVAPAQRLGHALLQRQPDNKTTAYLLQALNGDRSVTRSPDDYLMEYFDSFAEGFDRQLKEVLGYTVPEHLCRLVTSAIKDKKLDVLDLGCGTGLCGMEIAPAARTLIGVDLSPKMLQVARRRGVYSELVSDEITAYLARATESADVVLAADVLIYFGKLAPLFEGLSRVLRPEGLAAVSVELVDGHEFRLLPSGRFGHPKEYVRAAARQSGFIECASREIVIRLEAASPVRGELILFRRQIHPTSLAASQRDGTFTS